MNFGISVQNVHDGEFMLIFHAVGIAREKFVKLSP